MLMHIVYALSDMSLQHARIYVPYVHKIDSNVNRSELFVFSLKHEATNGGHVLKHDVTYGNKIIFFWPIRYKYKRKDAILILIEFYR